MVTTKVQSVPRHPHICRDHVINHLFWTASMHHPCRGYVKQYFTAKCSDDSKHCLYRLDYYQRRSHFLYIKQNKKLKKKKRFFLTICQLSNCPKKRQNNHQRERISRKQVTVQKCGPGGSTWSMHVFMFTCSPHNPPTPTLMRRHTV